MNYGEEYQKYVISNFTDSPFGTFIYAEIYSPYFDGNYTYHGIGGVGNLTDYSENVMNFFLDYLVSPKTKIGSYEEEIRNWNEFWRYGGSDSKIRSIKFGWGIEIDHYGNIYRREYNRQGILVRWNTIKGEWVSETKLIFINGRVYRYIPEYLYHIIWIGSSSLGLVCVFVIIKWIRERRRKRKSYTLQNG